MADTIPVAMSEEDKNGIGEAQQRWITAQAAGDTEAMNKAHADAEAIRAGYGFSGGDDGSQYIPLAAATPTDTSGTSKQYITDIYDAQTRAREAALKSAYDQSVLAAQNAKDAIPGTYNDARNTTSAQAAIGQANFNESAAASGLNSGTGSQARLAMNNTLQANMSSLDKQQAKDTASADLQLSQLKAKYESDIAQAIADGKFQEAQALYDDYQIRQQNTREDSQIRQQNDREDKQFQAQMDASKDETDFSRSYSSAQSTGDFSLMSPWWKQETITNAVGIYALNLRQQKYSATSIAKYLAGVVDSGAITGDEAKQIMISLGIA